MVSDVERHGVLRIGNRGTKIALVVLLAASAFLFVSMGMASSLQKSSSRAARSPTPLALRLVLVSFAVAISVFAIRGGRLALIADDQGLVIRNLGRTYRLSWKTVVRIAVINAGNVTGAAKCLGVSTADKTIMAKGTASYSAAKVASWQQEVLAVAPPHLHG